MVSIVFGKYLRSSSSQSSSCSPYSLCILFHFRLLFLLLRGSIYSSTVLSNQSNLPFFFLLFLLPFHVPVLFVLCFPFLLALVFLLLILVHLFFLLTSILPSKSSPDPNPPHPSPPPPPPLLSPISTSLLFLLPSVLEVSSKALPPFSPTAGKHSRRSSSL